MFDFDTPVDRKTSDSYKWQKYRGTDIIPMWVADMDFQSPPAVREALRQRIEHGVFGYAMPDAKLAETVMAHLSESHQWRIDREWIVWLPGLVTGLNVTCRSVGRSGSGVLTTVPVYPPFLSAPRLAGKRLHTTPLLLKDEQWQLNWDELKRGTPEGAALFLHCHPHNPSGRAFSRHELELLAEICLRDNMVICSDEIHCDLLLAPGCRHIPMASLDKEIGQRTITLMAPSKTFNIPGLGCAFAIIPDKRLRARFKRTMAGIVPHVNLLGFAAAESAYAHGQIWLKELLAYLRTNSDITYEAVNRMRGLHMTRVEATYLAWIDTRQSGIPEPASFFEQAGVGLSDGAEFGAPGFVRLNFGCPRSLLCEALKRMAAALEI